VVAFEVDCLDALTVPAGRSRRGAGARVLTDPKDIAAAVYLKMQTWIPAGDCNVAVRIGILRGCLMSQVTDPAPTSPVVGGLPQS
jgi:hypothetical protein